MQDVKANEDIARSVRGRDQDAQIDDWKKRSYISKHIMPLRKTPALIGVHTLVLPSMGPVNSKERRLKRRYSFIEAQLIRSLFGVLIPPPCRYSTRMAEMQQHEVGLPYLNPGKFSRSHSQLIAGASRLPSG